MILTGFGVRVYPSGRKSYIVNYRAGDGGRKAPNKRVMLGRCDRISADRARRMAHQVQVGNVAGGGDPANERAEARGMPTLGQAFDEFTEVTPECPVAVTSDHRFQHIAPLVGAVHVAGTKAAPLQIAELIEHEKRVTAGAAEMAVIGRAFLIAMGRADGAVHVEHDHSRQLPRMNPIVNGGGIMLHARRPGGPVAAAQNCATHGPLSVATRGRRCTAWSSMRRFDWRLSTRV